MPLLTIVEDYVCAVAKHAEVEQLEDGTIAATVPECFGIVALGADVHECWVNLCARLEDWVRVSLASGYELPVVEGIDLKSDADHILATFRDGAVPPANREFFGDEGAFQAALDRWDRAIPN